METLLQDIRIRRRTKQVARCSTNKKIQAKNSTARFNPNGFLNHSFQPLTDNKQLLKYQNGIETSYFNSLANLANLYQFEPLNVKGNVYPYTIHLSYEYARRWMNSIAPDTKLVIIHEEKRMACLATVKAYDTGSCLYYIAIEPLCKLLKYRRYKKQAELLTSVFAYLYQIAKVPYYGNQGNYLYYTYDTIEQWIEEEAEAWEEDHDKVLLELKTQKSLRTIIEKKIKLPYQLMCFEERINQFVPKTDFDKALLETSRNCFELYQAYPKRSIEDNTQINLLAADEEERISTDQYISFFWSSKGLLYEQVFDYVNSSLQEMSAIDEPQSIQLFDTPQRRTTHCFDFEEKFFSLLHELADLLNLVE